MTLADVQTIHLAQLAITGLPQCNLHPTSPPPVTHLQAGDAAHEG